MARIHCWFCGKSVSTEVPDNIIFRATAVCPECDSHVVDAAQQLAEADRAGLEAARLEAFKIMAAASAVQSDPEKANAIAASWVIEHVGRILAALGPAA